MSFTVQWRYRGSLLPGLEMGKLIVPLKQIGITPLDALMSECWCLDMGGFVRRQDIKIRQPVSPLPTTPHHTPPTHTHTHTHTNRGHWARYVCLCLWGRKRPTPTAPFHSDHLHTHTHNNDNNGGGNQWSTTSVRLPICI